MLLGQIRDALREGRPRLVDKLMREALNTGVPVSDILNQGVLPSIACMEDDSQEEELRIAKTLASAKALKQALDMMEPYLKMGTEEKRGKIIVGTADGDLHDVGKTLVRIMFLSKGFEVIDLGVDVSAKQYVKALEEHPDTDIVSISAIVSTALSSLRHIVQTLNELEGRDRFFIMVGGGPVTCELAESIQADRYTEDAKEAAEAAVELVESKKK